MTAPLPMRDYQVIARDHLRRHPRAALFLDMGLGKTRSTLEALRPEDLPALVVAPKRVAENVWDAEVAKWQIPYRIKVAKGERYLRIAALTDARADIVVIGRDNINDVLPYARQFRTLILDELSGYKGRGARWKAVRQIVATGHPRNVWGLTGTPAPNGLLDLWPQVYLLDEGFRLGKNITGFRSRYFVAGSQLPNGVVTEWFIRPEATQAIYGKIEDICLSMETDGRVDLPETTYNVVSVPMSANTRRLYKGMKEDLVADMELLGSVHTAGSAAIMTSKLGQITAGFMYVDDADLHDHAYDVIHQDKVTALREIVEGTGSPVLVAYQYTAERDMIRKAMPELVHTIEEPDVIDRWNAGEIPVLLAHPASIGHGLNLQTGPGHTIVWPSMTWNLEEWEQFNKRLSRPGQAHPVVIHMLVSPRTIDAAKRLRLEGKASVQDALLAHLESVL